MHIFRLLLFTFIILNSTFQISFSQAGEWTWMGGDSTHSSMGNFGLQGVPASTNEPPSRYACGYWTDNDGTFWIYGGTNAADDLWKFDPQTLEWTWMTGGTIAGIPETINASQGEYDPLNSPGSLDYGMFTWVTPDNHLWLFGIVSQLWQYNPGINQWAWMGGSALGGRNEGNCAWTDSSGNLWLFGGSEDGLNAYNDVWKYNVLTGLWTWMSGSHNVNDTGIYGVIGQPSVNNYPSARVTNLFWKDDSGNFWLSGGAGLVGGTIRYQDIWRFNPYSLQWTWVKGGKGSDLSQIGTNCLADIANKDGPRYENRSVWKICDDLILTYAGSSAPGEIMNDIWAYKPLENEWVEINSWPFFWPNTGNYGSLGIASNTNYPPARFGSVGFKYMYNNLWTFSGYDFQGYYYNDLWKYVLDTNCIGSLICSSAPLTALLDSTYSNFASCRNVCDGSGGIVVTGGMAPYHYSWQPTGDTTAAITNLCTGTYYVTVTDANGSSITDSVTIFAPVQDPIPIIVDKHSFCPGDTAHLCALTGFTLYNWNNGDTATCIAATSSGNYNVIVTDVAGCTITSGTVGITAYSLPQDSIVAHTTAICFGDSAQLCSVFAYASYQWMTGDSGNCTEAKQPGEYYVIVTDAHGCSDTSNQIEISVFPDPLDSITSNKTIFCAGDSARICAGASFFSYQWNFGGTGMCTEAKQAGDYYVTITDANGCTAESNHLSISNYPVPSVSIVRNGDTLSTSGAVSYQWYLDNKAIDNATSDYYIAKEQGSYSVAVTDTNGCSTMSSPVAVTGIWELNLEESIILYPNPSVSSWQLAVSSELVGSALQVFDEEGRLIWNAELRMLNAEIPAARLARGVYYLRISNERVSIVRKLVKM